MWRHVVWKRVLKFQKNLRHLQFRSGWEIPVYTMSHDATVFINRWFVFQWCVWWDLMSILLPVKHIVLLQCSFLHHLTSVKTKRFWGRASRVKQYCSLRIQQNYLHSNLSGNVRLCLFLVLRGGTRQNEWGKFTLYSALQHSMCGTLHCSVWNGAHCIMACSVGYSVLQHAVWGTVHCNMQCGVQCITACSVGYSALHHAAWGTVNYSMQCGVQCIAACSVGHCALQHAMWGTVWVCLYLDLIQKFSSIWVWGFVKKMCFETDMSLRYCPPSCLVIETPCFRNWFCLCDHGKVELNRWDLRFTQHECWGFRFHWLLYCCCSAEQCSRFFLPMTETEQIYTFT